MSPLRSVRARLALALLLVVAGVLVIVYLIVVPSFRASLQQAELDSLERSLRTVALPAFPSEPYRKQEFVLQVAPLVNARVIVYDLLGPLPAPLEPTADSRLDNSAQDAENDPVAIQAVRRQKLVRSTVRRGGQTYAEVAYPIGKTVVLLSSSLHDQVQTVALVRRRVLIAGGLAMAFAALLGYGGAGLFTRRIRRLERAAERIAAGNFEQPVVDHGADEVGQLARTFERMRIRLSHLDRARGEFIANASHELRTPLFSLGGFLELLGDSDLDEPTRDDFLVQMREQVARLTKLATDLLDLSRLDAGRLTVANEPIELSELAGELVTEFGPRAAAAAHPFEAAPRPDVGAHADAERVLQIGRILIENALVHTPAGTTVRVSTAQDGGRATLTVANDGPGIPRDAQQQIFERFYRLEGTRASGSGLGLAIARELAEVMDGRIELDSQNGWTLFTLVLGADSAEREFAGTVYRGQ